MQINIHPSWDNVFDEFIKGDVFNKLCQFIDNERRNSTIYPAEENVFKAFELTPFDDLNVVIVGQDPYHGALQAQGLAFSIQRGIKNPPSLKNILRELESDTGIVRTDGDLSDWARQGVLLLNSILTVRDSSPGSHADLAWETITDCIISEISRRKAHVIFVLWGTYAQSKEPLIDSNKHIILKSSHPSPFSAHVHTKNADAFLGSKPFSKINALLEEYNKSPIAW